MGVTHRNITSTVWLEPQGMRITGTTSKIHFSAPSFLLPSQPRHLATNSCAQLLVPSILNSTGFQDAMRHIKTRRRVSLGENSVAKLWQNYRVRSGLTSSSPASNSSVSD